MGVEEVLLVVRQAPLGHDGPAAGDDARHPLGRHRHEPEQHAGVHGEVVHPLLRLLHQGVAVRLPGQVLGHTADLLQRLVDRHRADRHRAVPEDPLPGLMDVPAGGEVHHRVGTPEGGPAELLDLVLDDRLDGGVADVGVDLHREAAADDHRLDFRMVDVGRDDGAAAGHLAPHELGRHPLAEGDELHFGSHLASARVVELRDGAAAAVDRALEGFWNQVILDPRFRGGDDMDPGFRRGDGRQGGRGAAGQSFYITLHDPWETGSGEPLTDICALRPAGVVDAEGGFVTGKDNLPHRHVDAAATLEGDLAGVGKGVRKRRSGHCRAPFAGMNRIRFQGYRLNPSRRRARGCPWRCG